MAKHGTILESLKVKTTKHKSFAVLYGPALNVGEEMITAEEYKLDLEIQLRIQQKSAAEPYSTGLT